MHFAIVGRFDEQGSYYLGLVEQIVATGAQQHVHFLGNVSEARKVALMRGCRAFMLTPVTSSEGGFEAFGLVFLEAGAAGRPVVGIADSGAESAITGTYDKSGRKHAALLAAQLVVQSSRRLLKQALSIPLHCSSAA